MVWNSNATDGQRNVVFTVLQPMNYWQVNTTRIV
jgi:hypothetical protein